MSDWNTLLQAALVGAERPWALTPLDKGGLSASTNETVGQLLREAQSYAKAANDTRGLLLRLAGAQATCQMAGWMASAAENAPIAPCGAESRVQASAAWTPLLSQALTLGPTRLQHQVCHAMDTAGLHAPAALLPALLHAGRHSVASRNHLLPVLGERGRWLAQQNPEWAYAYGVMEQADASTHWAHGNLDQRCTVLRGERATAPQAARQRLEADWDSLSAKDRGILLATLHIGLSADDEDFLTLRLKDRAQDVRRTAADLLAALPNSAYSQRMVARMQALVQPNRQEPGLVGRLLGKVLSSQTSAWLVEAPNSAPAEWKADVLELERPQHVSLGERAWWLFQLTSRTPLIWWKQHTGLAPAELLSMAKASEWGEALLRGWQHTMRWQADAIWAQALLDNAPAGRWDGRASLLALLAPEQREQYHVAQLASATNLHELVTSCLEGCEPHAYMGGAISEQIAQLLRKHIDQGGLVNDYNLRGQLADMVCALHPKSLQLLENITRSPFETPSLAEVLSLLDHVVRSRRQLFQLSEETLQTP